jgi:hypothetical protein
MLKTCMYVSCVRFDTKTKNYNTYICREKGVGDKKVLDANHLTFAFGCRPFSQGETVSCRWEGQMPFELACIGLEGGGGNSLVSLIKARWLGVSS